MGWWASSVVRPGDSGDGQAEVGAEPFADPAGHLRGDLGADGAMRLIIDSGTSSRFALAWAE